ncbi:phytoene/squalene synthase family protein [Streptomyces yangpuensis]|uniref:phytoene/squalene synthase family protein n=1 Tax=Streptomyces yangpuensis TaxID=1648182 RepID=UPI00380265B7
MTGRELDAAGITDPVLRAAYRRCRELNAAHGKTYFLATRLLPAGRRPAVHALYGFARWADDIVDSPDPGADAGLRGTRLAALQRCLEVGLEQGLEERLEEGLKEGLEEGLEQGDGGEPVVTALADTARRYAIDHRHFRDFMAAMRSDLVVTGYPTYADLRGYMHGSAAVIGLQMLPVLGTVVPRVEAEPRAAALGVAFQLTNFLRDVGEDLDRGRVYLPVDLLAGHGVERELLQWCRSTGRQDRRVLAALREFEALTRGVYREAQPGLAMLDPVSRPCIRTAYVLYGRILDAVGRDGYAVLHRRAVVPRRTRAAVAMGALARVTAVRLRHGRRSPLPHAPMPAASPAAHPARPVSEEVL